MFSLSDKGGNYPGAISLFMVLMCAVFLFSFNDFSDERAKYWFFIWVVFTLVILVHAFLVPNIWQSTRFLSNREELPQILSVINEHYLIGIRTLEVWSYFTAMWLFSWRVSLMSLKHVRVLLVVLLFVVLFQALYGVVHIIQGASSVLGLWTKEHYLDDATGTFVNRNHFSGMLALALPLILVGLLGQKPLIFPNWSKSYRVLTAIIVCIIVFLALILAHSRMGMAATIFGCMICGYFLILPLSKQSKKGVISSSVRYVGALTLILLFGIWFGLEDIIGRYVTLDQGNSRIDIWKAMFEMPIDVWLVGIGPGMYEDIAQIANPSHFSVRFLAAHNDYLEFIFEFGIVLGLLIVLSFVFWFKKVFYTDGYHILKAGVLGAIAAIALHSLVDFNLQIAGSALFFWFAIGLLVNVNLKVDSDHFLAKLEKKSSRMPSTKQEWLAFLRS